MDTYIIFETILGGDIKCKDNFLEWDSEVSLEWDSGFSLEWDLEDSLDGFRRFHQNWIYIKFTQYSTNRGITGETVMLFSYSMICGFVKNCN